MALTSQSLILYGYQITKGNQSIDFQAVSLGPIKQATIPVGYYSLSGLLTAISKAMNAADGANTYTASADRTIAGGTENRVSISTSGSFLSLLFSSGPRAASTAAFILGFDPVDYTGSTIYTGTLSSGLTLIPELVAYNFLGVDFMHKIYGNVNVSAAGIKEAVVFQVQRFWQAQFKYEPQAKAIVQWSAFFDWAIQQKLFEFTPEITSPNHFYEGTLEKSSDDGKGLGFKMTEMLPNFPFNFDTGLLTFRLFAEHNRPIQYGDPGIAYGDSGLIYGG